MSKGEIEKPERAVLALKLSLEGKKFTGIDNRFYKYVATVTKSLLRVLGMIGAREPLLVSFEELTKVSKEMRLINALLDNSIDRDGFISFSSDAPENVDVRLFSPTILAYVIFLNIGNVTIGFCARADVEAAQVGDKIEWKSTNLTSFDVRRLDNSSDKFQSYVNEVQTELAASGSITHTVS